MFLAYAALFSSIFEFLLFVGAVVLIYQVFLSDWVSNRRMRGKVNREKFNSIEKIAQVKLVSIDPKDIEQFITDNATYLSDQMVKKLVDRLESLRIDQVIASDDILKKRIADLPQPDQIEEEEEVHAKTARS